MFLVLVRQSGRITVHVSHFTTLSIYILIFRRTVWSSSCSRARVTGRSLSVRSLVKSSARVEPVAHYNTPIRCAITTITRAAEAAYSIYNHHNHRHDRFRLPSPLRPLLLPQPTSHVRLHRFVGESTLTSMLQRGASSASLPSSPLNSPDHCPCSNSPRHCCPNRCRPRRYCSSLTMSSNCCSNCCSNPTQNRCSLAD